MGARLRLRASKDLSAYPPEVQKIFQAMKTYGLIVADNGSDMYVTGTYDTRWNNDVLNPAFSSLNAADFDVVQLGWNGGPGSQYSTVQKYNIAAADYWQPLQYNYATGALHVAPVQFGSGPAPMTGFEPEQWIGGFLYDYSSSRFTQALYRFRDGF